MIQIIGGGAHADFETDIQDYLIIPMGAETFEEGIHMVVDVYNATKKVFKKYGKPISIADEGGFWPSDFENNEEGLKLLLEGIELAGYKPMQEVAIALDIAASEFYEQETEKYSLKLEGRSFDRFAFVDLLASWVDKYPIISIEDGCSEVDWEGHKYLTQKLGDRVQLIGDDIFATNLNHIKKGVEKSVCNSVLIKLNQVGTITETFEAIRLTKDSNYLPVISARSGETSDTTIVHVALASNAGQLKVGSVARSERTAKWNETIRIEQREKNNCRYSSNEIFSRFLKK